MAEAKTMIHAYAAFFFALDEELDTAFVGWTRERVLEAEGAKIPLAPPFPFVFAPLPNSWWEHLLDYYCLVVPDDVDAQQRALDESLGHDEKNTSVFRQALFAGPTGPVVYTVPPEFVAASASLSDAQCADYAEELARLYVPDDFRYNPITRTEEDYRELRELFRTKAIETLQKVREFMSARPGGTPCWFWGWYE